MLNYFCPVLLIYNSACSNKWILVDCRPLNLQPAKSHVTDMRLLQYLHSPSTRTVLPWPLSCFRTAAGMSLGGKLSGGSAFVKSCGLSLTSSPRLEPFPSWARPFHSWFNSWTQGELEASDQDDYHNLFVIFLARHHWRELAICSNRKIASNNNCVCQSLLDLIGRVKNTGSSPLPKSAHSSTVFHWLLFP